MAEEGFTDTCEEPPSNGSSSGDIKLLRAILGGIEGDEEGEQGEDEGGGGNHGGCAPENIRPPAGALIDKPDAPHHAG